MLIIVKHFEVENKKKIKHVYERIKTNVVFREI